MVGYGHITVSSLVDATPGLGMKVNHSSFSTTNNGEAFLHGYTDEVAANVNGYVMWNGVKRTVPRTVINPDAGVPYNKTIYIVMRLSSASAQTGTVYNVWYESGWIYGAASGPSAAGWTWNDDTDIVLGQYVEPGSEKNLVDAYLYWPPRTSTQASRESAYERSVAAGTVADAAKTSADDANGKIDGLEIGGRNLLVGSSEEWTSRTLTGEINQGMILVPNTDAIDIPALGFQAGDRIQVSFDIKFSDDITATGTGTARSFIQGNANTGSSWVSVNYGGGGGTKEADIREIISSTSKTAHISTWFLVVDGMVDGTYTGRVSANIRFDYYTGTVYVRRVMVEKGTKPSAWKPAPEDFENHLAEETEKVYTNSVASSKGFFNEAIKEYVRTSDIETFKQTVRTELNQTSDSIEMVFNTAVEQINALSDGTASEFSEIKKYIRFVDGSIILGQEDNPLILTLVNNRIAFTSNGTEVAYFSDNQMAVDNITVVNGADLCGLKIAKDTNGNIFIS